VAVSNRANPLSSLKGFRGAVNPYFYEYAFVVIMQTQKGIDLLEEKYRKVKFIKIGNPFNIPDNPSLLKNRAKIIINVGSIGGNKNQHLLVRYFAEIEHKKDWIIYFVGDGPKREILKDEIEKHKLCESVFILGVRDDVSDLLNNAQIFAFTSSSEGFPNALGEAMAAGCSCISFDCLTGPSELIDNNLNGYLINSGDDEGYKEKLQLLMNDEQLRENFGIAARNKIKNNFSVNEIAKKYLMLSDSSKK
jgi:GalNAc-alpha-(1->4)-GalNAc-alpha-(1->3)-diNAcBac-PP-undecaprenol alpha-1,4-N-acetyl-D-galactosaminyltransferase